MSDRLIISGTTMTSARPRRRSPWIALAAFLLAMTATGGANGCTTMAEGTGACAAVCGGCESPSSGTPSQDAAVAAAAHLHAPSLAGEVCESTPTSGCACRSGQPEAPEPNTGQRTTGEETDAGRDLAQGEAAHDAALRSPCRPIQPTGSPPQGAPLYLRHSRLLI